MTQAVEWVEGQRYRFVYERQSGNYRWYTWECIGTYLSHDADEGIVISLRPLAGTATLTKQMRLISAEPTDEPNRPPYRHRS